MVAFARPLFPHRSLSLRSDGTSGGLGEAFGWRAAFWFEAICMVPFIILLLAVPPQRRQRRATAVLTADELVDTGVHSNVPAPSLLISLRELLANPVYVMIVLGYSAFTFVVGGLGLFMPKYTQIHLNMSTFQAAVAFGGIVASAGLVGTALGGWLVDRKPHVSDEARLLFSLRFCALFMLLGTPFAVLGIGVGNSPASMLILLFIGMLLVFCTTGTLRLS